MISLHCIVLRYVADCFRLVFVMNSCDTFSRCGTHCFSRRQRFASLVSESNWAMHPAVHAQLRRLGTKISSSLIPMVFMKSMSTSAAVVLYLDVDNSSASDGGHPPPSSLKLVLQWRFFGIFIFSISRANFQYTPSIALSSSKLTTQVSPLLQ
jgi:hypothetical protein